MNEQTMHGGILHYIWIMASSSDVDLYTHDNE